jgi:hypothetical protein
MDLFRDQLIPENQIHDFNPGILENGLFWVVPIPDASVDVNPGAGRARMVVKDLAVEDYFTLENALLDGSSVASTSATVIAEVGHERNGAFFS